MSGRTGQPGTTPTGTPMSRTRHQATETAWDSTWTGSQTGLTEAAPTQLPIFVKFEHKLLK